MKRSTPLRRTAFRRIPQRIEGPPVERERHPIAPRPADAPRGTYAGGTSGAAPKTEPHRDPVLLELARGRPCLLMVPAVCTHRVDQTVACHQNEGKGMGTKQSDAMTCWGCAACHVYYDRSGADRQRKRDLFMEAHARQVLAWRLLATDHTEPERFRNAARRALEHLNATPIGDTP